MGKQGSAAPAILGNGGSPHTYRVGTLGFGLALALAMLGLAAIGAGSASADTGDLDFS
jgi:hypothetical protein